MKLALRKIAAAFESGYDWPIDWNEYAREQGWKDAVIAAPTESERIVRALVWACNQARELLSDAIHPDGPRGR